MGLFGKKNKNKEKGVPFWKRNKQKQEEELVQEELTEQESPAEESDRAFAGEEEDIAAAAIREQEAQEQDEVEKARLGGTGSGGRIRTAPGGNCPGTAGGIGGCRDSEKRRVQAGRRN